MRLPSLTAFLALAALAPALAPDKFYHLRPHQPAPGKTLEIHATTTHQHGQSTTVELPINSFVTKIVK